MDEIVILTDTGDHTKTYRVRIRDEDGLLKIDFIDHWDPQEDNPLVLDIFNNVLQANFDGIEPIALADVVEKP